MCGGYVCSGQPAATMYPAITRDLGTRPERLVIVQGHVLPSNVSRLIEITAPASSRDDLAWLTIAEFRHRMP